MARSFKPVHLVVTAVVGLGTFVVAAKVSMGLGAPANVAEAVAPAPHPRATASAEAPSATKPAKELSLGERAGAIPASEGNAFAKLSWLPPPPPPPPAPPPAPPPPPPVAVAPPLPFSFVGMVERGTGKPQAFLSKGDTLLVVSSGDVLDNNTYRVDSLSMTAVVLTYLPMGTQQTINVSGGSP